MTVIRDSGSLISGWTDPAHPFGKIIVAGNRRVEILLVESDVQECQWLRTAFEQTGLMNVAHAVSSSREALDCLRLSSGSTKRPTPSLILLGQQRCPADDRSLSEGLELLGELKSDPDLRSIPVVVVTETSATADILNAYSQGACSFVSKPSSSTARLALISRFASYWACVAELPRCPPADGVPADHSQQEAECELHEPVDVLVIDDSEDDVFLLREAFRTCPLVRFLEVAEDGETALRMLRREAPFADARLPGLVLLDINMPRMNGFEVLSAIRSDPRLCRIPVVMLTTSQQESDILRAYADGACSFISKPVDFDRLKDIARHFTAYWTQVADVPAPEALIA